jgi:glycosyltransferase involved in cell wall biosynthesis
VARAIDSVLAQSFEDFELVVVVDGADADTLSTLRAQTDPRLHYIVNPTAVGGGEARNIGVRRARGQWVAFLDDDDEWLPEKLEVQLNAVLSRDAPYPVGFCRVIARSERGENVWPRRPPLTCPQSLYHLLS